MSTPQNPFQHQVVDAMVPLALRIVGAVHDDDPAELLDAIATARTIGDTTAWMTALLIAVAGLVPDDRTVAELTAWLTETAA